MTEHPILFSAPMVRAILGGRKTQTRRIFALRRRVDAMEVEFIDGEAWAAIDGEPWRVPCPYGSPGKRLWVRETWAPIPRRPIPQAECWWGSDRDWPGAMDLPECPERAGKALVYAATWDDRYPMRGHWHPSIHMPRWASRLTLQVEAARVERLQDITEEDARTEGVSSVAEYADLWDRINGKRAPWSANPWVWVVTFGRVA